MTQINSEKGIEYDERKARETVIRGELHDIIIENEPMVAIALIMENLPKFYEFLSPRYAKAEIGTATKQ